MEGAFEVETVVVVVFHHPSKTVPSRDWHSYNDPRTTYTVGADKSRDVDDCN
jgi:hypothetical protein